MAIKSKIKTKEIDHGFKRILKELKKLEYKPLVKIGFPVESSKTDDEHGDDGFVTVLDLAIWREFGTINMPERSFLRASFDKNKPKYLKLNKKLLGDIYAGKKTVENSLDILGETILNDIKKFLINDEVKPPTLKKEKTSSAVTSFANQLENVARAQGLDAGESKKTLIDTAQMLNSLTFKRVMKP